MAKKEKVKWYQKAKTYRYLIQGIVFLYVLQLLFKLLPTKDITVTAEAYCPFGGLAGLYQLIITKGQETLTHITPSNFIIFGIVILITLLLRSGFCGWVCPFGTLQDLVRGLGKKIGSLSILKSTNKKYHRMLKDNRKTLAQIDKYARYLKYVVLVYAVASAAYYAHLEYRDYDPFASLLKIVELEVTTGFYIFGVVMVLSLFIDRPWCKYACPLGAFVGLVGKLSPTRVTRNLKLCTNCNLCTKSCPMNIDVANETYVKSDSCNHCLECIDACPTKGALDLRVMLPGAIPSQPQNVDTIKE